MVGFVTYQKNNCIFSIHSLFFGRCKFHVCSNRALFLIFTDFLGNILKQLVFFQIMSYFWSL